MSDNSEKLPTDTKANGAPKRAGRNNPPEEHRFKPGGRGGPGRPKGSRNREDFDVVFDEPVQIGTDRLGRPIRRTGRRVGNMQLRKLVMEGNLQAIKIMKDHELKLAALKTNAVELQPTIAEMRKQQGDDATRRTLIARLTKLLETMGVMRKEGWLFDEHGAATMEPWLQEAISDYRKKVASR